MLQFLLPLINSLGAAGGAGAAGAGAAGGMGGLANILGGGLGQMAGTPMAGGAQGATQGSGLMRVLSGGGMPSGEAPEDAEAAMPRRRFQIGA